jgi:hypothetical protein
VGGSQITVVVGEDQDFQLRETGSQASGVRLSWIRFWSRVAKTAVTAPTTMMIGKGFTSGKSMAGTHQPKAYLF